MQPHHITGRNHHQQRYTSAPVAVSAMGVPPGVAIGSARPYQWWPRAPRAPAVATGAPPTVAATGAPAAVAATGAPCSGGGHRRPLQRWRPQTPPPAVAATGARRSSDGHVSRLQRRRKRRTLQF